MDLVGSYFDNQDEINKHARIFQPESLANSNYHFFRCPICMDEAQNFRDDEWDSLQCGHKVCIHCYEGFLQNLIETEPKSALAKVCPG